LSCSRKLIQLCMLKDPFQTALRNMPTLINALVARRVLIISNRDLGVKPLLYGEDYYMHSIASEMERRGILVEFAIFNENKTEPRRRNATIDIEEIVGNHTVVVLHNISPLYICKAKMRKKIWVVMPVYFVWNRISPINTIIRSLGLPFWQPLVNEYLVPTPSLAGRLRRLGVVRKISILPPEYTCTHCNQIENSIKRAKLETQLPRVVEMVYIGQMIPKRFPLTTIVNVLNKDDQREYKLGIYTASQVKEETYRKGNAEIRIVRKCLSDKQKCEILRKSDVFIAPAKGTSMEPPISVIEAEYHGNIIVRF